MEQAIRSAVKRELVNRGYDNYPASEDIFEELLDDITEAVLAITLKSILEGGKSE